MFGLASSAMEEGAKDPQNGPKGHGGPNLEFKVISPKPITEIYFDLFRPISTYFEIFDIFFTYFDLFDLI